MRYDFSEDLVDLYVRIKDGNRIAMMELYARYGKQMKTVIRRVLASWEAARPVYDTYALLNSAIIAMAESPCLDDPGPGLVVTDLECRARDALKKNVGAIRVGGRETFVGDSPLAAMESPLRSPYEMAEFRDLVAGVCACLDDVERGIVERWASGQTFVEIGEEFGTPSREVSRKFARAMAFARSRFGVRTECDG